MVRTELFSTTFGGADKSLGTLSVKTLHSHSRSATRVTLVSAFYDRNFLSTVVTGIPASRRKAVLVEVYLHGFSGSRLKADLQVLRKWRDEQGLKNVKILLVTRGALFHSKLVIFETKGAAVAFVGSANATSAAYDENEEIMLSIGGSRLHAGIRAYVDRLAVEARPLDDVEEPEVHSLIAFFRTGDIYYKPNAVPLFRFDLRLPERLRDSLSTLTDPIPGFSAKTSRTYNPFAGLATEEDDDDGAASRVSIRPYAVQTCFGWWAPEAFHEDIDETVSKASSKKRDRLLNVSRVFLAGVANGSLVEQAKESFEMLARVARTRGIPLDESPQTRLDRFDEFLIRCRGQLSNKRWFERATRAFEHSSMPEIWSDPVARDEFESSFFDYLQYVNAATTSPKLLAMLGKAVGIDAGDGAAEIRAKLVAHLRTEGWSPDKWGARRKDGTEDSRPKRSRRRPVGTASIRG